MSEGKNARVAEEDKEKPGGDVGAKGNNDAEGNTCHRYPNARSIFIIRG